MNKDDENNVIGKRVALPYEDNIKGEILTEPKHDVFWIRLDDRRIVKRAIAQVAIYE
jgi:hypothetical protein